MINHARCKVQSRHCDRSSKLPQKKGNNKVLRRVKKGLTMEQAEDAIKNACELGLFYRVRHTFGLDNQ